MTPEEIRACIRAAQLGATDEYPNKEKSMLRNDDEREVALECLRLAVARGEMVEPVNEARRYFSFVTGQDSAEAIEKVRAALDELR